MRIVPKNVPRIAPASVPPEYWPEHDGALGACTTVVVACRGMRSAGVAGRSIDASAGLGAFVVSKLGISKYLESEGLRGERACPEAPERAHGRRIAYHFSNHIERYV